MNKKKRVAVAELNPHLLCILCGGYYVDATTVIECLHTFCKSCIVRYLETSKFCPICDVLVHKTHPLLSIRPDKSLQNIVYKLIPTLLKNEMCRRKRFYSERVDAIPLSEVDGGDHAKTDYLIPADSVSVALKPLINQNENHKDQNGFHTRYFNCPAGVTLGQLKRLLRAKFDLPDKHPVIISLSKDDVLEDKFTLIDVAYIKSWKKESPLVLYYKIYFNKRVKMESWIEERPIKIEEREKCDYDDDSSMPKLESEIENLCMIDCEKRSIPKLSPIGELPSVSPPILFTETSSCESETKSVVQSISISKPNSVSVSTYKTIIPAPLRTVSDVLSFSSIGLSHMDSLSTRNCGYSYGIGLLANPNGSVQSIFPGSLVDPTKIGGTVLPFGLTLTPSLICAPPGVNNLSASFSDHSNLASVGGINLHSVLSTTEPSNNLILSLSNLETSVVPSVSSHPISSVVSCESSGVSNLSASKNCKKPKLIRPKKSEKRPPVIEEKEVQLTISESGVMIVNEGDISSNQLPGLINPVYSEANDLLTKIESGTILSSDQYSEDSKGSDISDGAEKLAQIKEEISCILNTLSEEGQNSTQISTNESQSSNIFVSSLPIVVPSMKTDFLSLNFSNDISCRGIQKTPFVESESSKESTLNDLPDLKRSILIQDKFHNKDENISTNIPVSTSCKPVSKNEAAKQPVKKTELPKPLLSTTEPLNTSKQLVKKTELIKPSSTAEPLNSPLCHANTKALAMSQLNKEIDKKKAGRRSSQPVGYKTLKVSPRGWNPTISREILHKKISSTPKPSKFFKARNSAILSSISEKSSSITALAGSRESNSTAIKLNEIGNSGSNVSSKDSTTIKDDKLTSNVSLNISHSNVMNQSSESTKSNKPLDNNSKLGSTCDNRISKNMKILLNKQNSVSTDEETSCKKTIDNECNRLNKNLSTVEKSNNSLYEATKLKASCSSTHSNKISQINSKSNDVNANAAEKNAWPVSGKVSEDNMSLQESNKISLQSSKNRSIAKAISYLHTKVDASDVLRKKYVSPSLVSSPGPCSLNVRSASASKGSYSNVPSVPSVHSIPITSVPSVCGDDQVPLLPSIQTTQVKSLTSIMTSQVTSVSSQTTQVPTIPSIQTTLVPSIPSVQGTLVSPVPCVQATQASISSVQATKVPSIPFVHDTQVLSIPSVQTTHISSIPSVQATQIPSIPSVQANQVTSIPTVQTAQVSSVPSIQATQVPSIPSIQANQVPSIPSICTAQVQLLPTIQTTKVASLPSASTIQIPLIPSVQTTQIPPTSSVLTTQVPSVQAIQVSSVSSVCTTQIPILPPVQSSQVLSVPFVQTTQVPSVSSIQTNQLSSLSAQKTATTKSAANVLTPNWNTRIINDQIPSTHHSFCTNIPKMASTSENNIKQSKNSSPKRMLENVVPSVAITSDSPVSKEIKSIAADDVDSKHVDKRLRPCNLVATHSSLSTSNTTHLKYAQSILPKALMESSVSNMSSEVCKALNPQLDGSNIKTKDNAQDTSLDKLNNIPPLPAIHICSKIDMGLIESQQNLASPVDSASDKENKALKETNENKNYSSITKETYFLGTGDKLLHDNNLSPDLFSGKTSKSVSSGSAVSLKPSDVNKSQTLEKVAQPLQKFSSDNLSTSPQNRSKNLGEKVKSTSSSSLNSNSSSAVDILTIKDANISKALGTSHSSLNPVVTSLLNSNNKIQSNSGNEKPYPHNETISTVSSSDSIGSCNSFTQNVCSQGTTSYVNSQGTQCTSVSSSNSPILSNKLVYKQAEPISYVANQTQVQNNNTFVCAEIATEVSLTPSVIETFKGNQKAITTTVETVQHSTLPTSSYNIVSQFPTTSTSKTIPSNSNTPVTCTNIAMNVVANSNCAHAHQKESSVKSTAISHTTTASASTSISDKSQYSLSVSTASNSNTQITFPNSYSRSQPAPISSSSSMQMSNNTSSSVSAVASNTQTASKTVSSQCSYLPAVNMDNSLTATDHSRYIQSTTSLSNSNPLAVPMTSAQNVQYEGNSGLSTFSQNNCEGEGFYFGNSIQNNSFPFFNNFMPFGNVSLPYTAPINSYGGTSSCSTIPQTRSKLSSNSSCNEFSKANTTYSVTNTTTTPMDSYQNNSFLSYPTISSVPPTLQDISKIIPNLLGSSVPNMSNEQQKTNLKSTEELDRLFQTISSSIAENKIADFFASSSTSSNDEAKADKHSKDAVLSNTLENTLKQNSQSSTMISAAPVKGTNSETTASSIHDNVDQPSEKINSKNVAYNKDKEISQQVSHANTKASLASFSSEVSNSSNFQKALSEYPIPMTAMTSQSYSAAASTAGEVYKNAYHQSQCCNHQNEASNALSSEKNISGSNLQHNKTLAEHTNISTLSNTKKSNTLIEKTTQVVPSSSYGTYSGTSHYNSSSVASANTIESATKKNMRASGCSNVTAAVTSNSGVHNYHEGMSCISSNATAAHKHVPQTSSWNSNPLNPFLFNNSGDSYGCVPSASTYKSGYPPNTNSCVQQNMFRNTSSTSAMPVKDNSMNTHSQTNYNSSANLSCSPKNSLAANSQYGTDNSKKGLSNSVESYENFSVGSQKYNPSHASLYYSNYNNNYANFFSNSQSQSSPSLTPFVSGAGYNFPLSGSKFTSGQQYLNFSQNNHNNSYFPSGNFNVNSGSNYQNCINQTPSSNTGASNTNSNLGSNFSGPLCNISLPYYSNCSFSYNSYPYFYQGDMSLLSPTASFMPPFSCLPSRQSLSSRNTSSSQSFNDFSLQSGFFPMMPFVSPLQGNGARATPSPMTGGISSSFGARPFSSNYPQKQITHDTTKLSQKGDQQSPKAGNTSGSSSNKSKHRKTNNGSKHKSSTTKEVDSKLQKTAALTVPTFTPSVGMSSGSSSVNSTIVNRTQLSTEEGNNNALNEGNRNTISDDKQQKKKDIPPHVN